MSRRKNKKRKNRSRAKQPRFKRRDVGLDQLKAIIERASLSEADRDQLTAAVETLAFITQELEQSGATIARLRKLLFGPSSEKTRDVLNNKGNTESEHDAQGDNATDEDPVDKGGERGDDTPSDDSDKPKKKRKGHGRNGAAAYTGADKVSVAHDTLSHGDRCPGCDKGKVYRLAQPAVLVRVKGVAPLSATVYELERLRCNLCGEVFTAKPPEGVGEEKYDESTAAMIALLKYGCGLPFNRMERLGADLGIPLPAATQWDVIEEAVDAFEPVWAELVRQAAHGEVVYIDDTKAQILEVYKQIQQEVAEGQGNRTGIFTSGVVSTIEGRQLAVFFTGREHAGENLAKVLAHRPKELPPPIQMSDALSRNTSPNEFKTIVANCLTHGRRKFVDAAESFPEEVGHVLETLGQVYRYDADAREAEMSPDERLRYHREHSKPLMDDLRRWFETQLDEHKVESNSALGKAFKYMQKHWDKLTRFLSVPGAPLDNNLCERVLKRAIMHRKNSLFFRTDYGSHVGDLFISLIHTAELCGANPFDYLLAVQRHKRAVKSNPEQWMPWNYTTALPSSTGLGNIFDH